MTYSLFPNPCNIWPSAVLESIYQVYPRKENRAQALRRIGEALDRICDGEIDGTSRTQADAIAYLRQKSEEARALLYGKDSRFIPHPSTYFHNSYYLRAMDAQPTKLPDDIEAAISVLAEYPGQNVKRIRKHTQAFIPALVAISDALQSHAYSYLMERVCLYAIAVKTWPEEELRYVPNPKRWFAEQRFLQSEKQWFRANANWQAEREQIARVLSAKSNHSARCQGN